jgi:hypothetical protein
MRYQKRKDKKALIKMLNKFAMMNRLLNEEKRVPNAEEECRRRPPLYE